MHIKELLFFKANLVILKICQNNESSKNIPGQLRLKMKNSKLLKFEWGTWGEELDSRTTLIHWKVGNQFWKNN